MDINISLRAVTHLDIFACDIAIKTFFIQYFFPVCIENIFLWDDSKYFEMSLKFFLNQNVFLSFYQNIVCKNVWCV
jgi:hypothetical protein